MSKEGPLKLLYESTGMIIMIELENNSTLRATVKHVDDYMNVVLKDVIITDQCGKISKEEVVYVKGNTIKFVVFPPTLEFAPEDKKN
ncbi:small nuclear ribonucleoprotein Sm D3 [Hamiltosporidium magnivora]|uniref:Small nuclear ribonucleoprotein Sm D3 n=1 Tax=Hamiltosporidium magnivora TaxID=148818 RepID=A0A4Q9LKA4_9MICR|nr:small nuclear ribonucleoprotein Sm D3 [Hamiltosporidium magnivora]